MSCCRSVWKSAILGPCCHIGALAALLALLWTSGAISQPPKKLDDLAGDLAGLLKPLLPPADELVLADGSVIHAAFFSIHPGEFPLSGNVAYVPARGPRHRQSLVGG